MQSPYWGLDLKRSPSLTSFSIQESSYHSHIQIHMQRGNTQFLWFSHWMRMVESQRLSIKMDCSKISLAKAFPFSNVSFFCNWGVGFLDFISNCPTLASSKLNSLPIKLKIFTAKWMQRETHLKEKWIKSKKKNANFVFLSLFYSLPSSLNFSVQKNHINSATWQILRKPQQSSALSRRPNKSSPYALLLPVTSLASNKYLSTILTFWLISPGLTFRS